MARRGQRGGRRGKAIASLGELIPRVYPAGEPQETLEARVFGAFRRSLSERMRANAGPTRFRDGVLYVNTSTSAWADTLSLDASEILRTMRARLGTVAVKRIAFRCGPFTPAYEPPKAPRPSRRELTDLPPVVAKELAQIASDGVRDAVARAALSALSNVPKSSKSSKR